MRFRVGARTDVGKVRDGNEDAYMANDPLFAVADGMGGHQGGEVASHVALETLERIVEGPGPDGGRVAGLAEVVREANRAVLDRASTDPGLSGMGTTLTAVLVGEGRISLVHVGDSRAYLLRDGHLTRLTKDHTVVERLVEQGRLTPDEAEIHPQRSILTNALGVDREIQVDEATHDVRDGDRLLLCSDGLTGMVSEDDIVRILTEHRDPQATAETLVDAANTAGGQDNITVVILDAEGEGGGGAATEAAAPAAAGADRLPASEAAKPATIAEDEEERPRRWPRRLLLWVVLPLVVVATALFGVKRLFIDQQWFVGVQDGRVALFRGVPARPLGISLASPEHVTGLPADEVRQFAAWGGLDEGITADTREDAERLIEQMRTDLERQRGRDDRGGGP